MKRVRFLFERVSFLVLIFVLAASNLRGQFFEEVGYLGAMGQVDWTEQWVNYRPDTIHYPIHNTELYGLINKNTTLQKKNVYLLRGEVYVTNNATLFIEPGTIIRSEAGTNARLVITQGSRIRAIGSAKDPIIFTSNNEPGKREPADWGGIVLLGNSVVNTKAGKSALTGFSKKLLTTFGGNNEEDNSGILQYIRIEFAGTKVDHSEESASLVLAGVGGGTTLDHLQVSSPFDDSFSWIGGNVNAKYLVSNRCKDDDFDVTMGYIGKVQFCIAFKPKVSELFRTSVVEVHGYENALDYNARNPTNCIFSNITAVSLEQVKEPFNDKIAKYAIHLCNGGIGGIHNSIFLGGFQFGIYVDGKELSEYVTDGSVSINHNIFMGNGKPVGGQKVGKTDLNSWYSLETVENKYYRNIEFALLEDPFGKNFNLKPRKEVSEFINAAGFLNIEAKQFKTKFRIDKTPYIGAFDRIDWTKEWVNYSPEKAVYPDHTVYVSDNIAFNTTWTKNNTYLVVGNLEVNNGATLSIEPGTVIRFDAETKASLIVTPNCRIKAIGTASEPVVFTSSKPIGERRHGDWGGLVIAGNDKINSKDFTSVYQLLPKTYQFGGMTRNEESGILKYVRIEFAGAALKDEKMSALTLAGVEDIEMEYVQAAYAAGNSFEWIGGRSKSKYLVSTNCMDDDFVPSFGYSGTVQYGLAKRDPLVAEMNKANSIESVGHTNENINFLLTNARLYNFTVIGPIRQKQSQYNQNYNAAVHLSRNSAISIYNSVFTGFPKGLFLDGAKVEFNATSRLLNFKRNIISGCVKPLNVELNSKWAISEWFTANNNLAQPAISNLKLRDPFSSDKPSYLPSEGSPCKMDMYAAKEE